MHRRDNTWRRRTRWTEDPTLVRMLLDVGRPADPPLAATELEARSDSVRGTHACQAAMSHGQACWTRIPMSCQLMI